MVQKLVKQKSCMDFVKPGPYDRQAIPTIYINLVVILLKCILNRKKDRIENNHGLLYFGILIIHI